MKALTTLLLGIFALNISANDVFVQGHTRSDGTYVSPHMRSAPDSSRWNNYGTPSYEQRQEERTDIMQRDYDSDRTFNQFDYDDDNDGIQDDFEQ